MNKKILPVFSLSLLLSTLSYATSSNPPQGQEENSRVSLNGFTRVFPIERCSFQNTGANPYFSLEPGHKTIFEGKEDGNDLRLEITVLDETQEITLPDRTGPIVTRIIEERETENGELVEVSRNFFAICDKTNDVYYFGEDVQIFEEDGSVSTEGQWKAGVNNATPGIIMPGTFLFGSKYYQEVAPDIAEDRAENTQMGVEIKTDAGSFTNCVKVTETTPLEPDKSTKIYCPDVGLVRDDVLTLIQAPGLPAPEPAPAP